MFKVLNARVCVFVCSMQYARGGRSIAKTKQKKISDRILISLFVVVAWWLSSVSFFPPDRQWKWAFARMSDNSAIFALNHMRPLTRRHAVCALCGGARAHSRSRTYEEHHRQICMFLIFFLLLLRCTQMNERIGTRARESVQFLFFGGTKDV